MTTLHLPPDGKLRAFTVHEPYATMIAMGFKSLENRLWQWPEKSLPLPCTVAVHASASSSMFADEAVQNALAEPRIRQAFDNPKAVEGKRGSDYFYKSCIVGLVDVIACERMPDTNDEDAIDAAFEQWPISNGPARDIPRGAWAFGPWCFVLDNFRRFEQGIVCRGQQKLWQVPADAQQLIESGRKILIGAQDLPREPVSVDGTAVAPLGGVKEVA